MKANAHIEQCQNIFSFNWAPGIGWTDAEGPERAWSVSNSLAGSTKKMGPGSHWDMLDEHFGDWNWQKTITLCMCFLILYPLFHSYPQSVASYLIDCAEEALENRAVQVEALKDLTKNIQPKFVKQWGDAKKAWELNNKKPNPFVPKVQCKYNFICTLCSN